LFDWIKQFDPTIKDIPYSQLFIQFGTSYEGKHSDDKANEQMVLWFQKYREDIKDHLKLTASDVTYGLTVNPFLFLLFTFSTHILDAFPLGSKLDFMPLVHFLNHLTQQIGGDFSKDSLLTLSNKYHDYIKQAKDTTIFQLMNFFDDEPDKTFSAFLKLIDPLAKVLLEE
jgi:hypothetical protein